MVLGGIDRAPRNTTEPKGTIWKADYHTSRAMINCVRRLRDLFPRHVQYAPVNRNATPGAKALLEYLVLDLGKEHPPRGSTIPSGGETCFPTA